MKKYKSMMILLAVLLVFVVLYFATTFIPSDEEASEPAITVTNIAEMSTISYTDGETEMSFINTDGVWNLENSEITLDQDTVTSMVSIFQSIQAERKITEPDALADYGLEKPQYTITMTDENGTDVTLYIGNVVADSNYYAKKADSEVVYTISSTVVDALEFDTSALEVEETTEETTE